VVHKIQIRRAVSAGAVAILLMGVYVAGQAAGRNTLWRIVHNQCMLQWRQQKLSSPCIEVSTDAHGNPESVVLKDIRGQTQFLLLPTAPVSGLESKILQEPQTPNYFASAWGARHYIEDKLGHVVPRDDIGFAVNAMSARTQDQLHIHIDCLRPAVVQILRTHAVDVSDHWKRFPVPLNGEIYWARRVDQPDLKNIYPFRLLAEAGSSWRHNMGRNTLIVAPTQTTNGQAGFILLARHPATNQDMPAHGEDLQDHACAIAG
jgi:CDP-diacylglycerol pyrophosphatase